MHAVEAGSRKSWVNKHGLFSFRRRTREGNYWDNAVVYDNEGVKIKLRNLIFFLGLTWTERLLVPIPVQDVRLVPYLVVTSIIQSECESITYGIPVRVRTYVRGRTYVRRVSVMALKLAIELLGSGFL